MRATFAHEIAHLLLDRTTALPLAEVLGGRPVGNTEERARAFAAQLLLPKEEAGQALANAADPAHTVDQLQSATASARKSSLGKPVTPTCSSAEVHAVLRTFVSRPWQF